VHEQGRYCAPLHVLPHVLAQLAEQQAKQAGKQGPSQIHALVGIVVPIILTSTLERYQHQPEANQKQGYLFRPSIVRKGVGGSCP